MENYRTLKTNATTKAGRPQKYSEQWRKDVYDLEPLSKREWEINLKSSVIRDGGIISYGILENGVWHDLQKGQIPNCMKATFPDKVLVMSAKTCKEDYDVYVDKFRAWQNKIFFGANVKITDLPFEENAGVIFA